MDLEQHPATGSATAGLLDAVNDQQQRRRGLEIEQLETIVAWAEANIVTDRAVAATESVRTWDGILDTGLAVAGPGAPLVSEFALMELVAVLDRTPDGGRDHVGKVVELAWRLPSCYAEVLTGRAPHWKALRAADLTRSLNADAAAYVDRHLAFALPGCSWVQVERLVAEAVVRFDPALAEERRRAAAEQRRFDVHHGDQGLAFVDGVLDAADARDLDEAVRRRASALGEISDATIDVRRSIAAGDLARHDLALDLRLTDPDTGEVVAAAPGRRAVLHVHVSHAALTGAAGGEVGRCGEVPGPLSSEQIRAWCAAPGTTVVVRPVIDLADHVPVDSYEVPDRLRTRVELRDHRCVFPGCPTPAVRCDIDHGIAHADGGSTCPCNLAPLCRRHHRAKTHSAWRSTTVAPGTYEWTSPHGHRWRVDHTGTRRLGGADPPRQ